jgi:flagellar protein FlaG
MDIASLHNTAPVAAPTPSAGAENPAQNRELVKAVKAVNGAELLGSNNELTFAVDRLTQRTVIRLVDRETRAVVRQIPAESVLRMAEDAARSSPG